MAYLSSDQITGKVLVNLHSDGLAIYNNTSIKRNIEKQEIYSIDKPVSTNITKFSKGSILNGFNVPIGEDISRDFTVSAWMYVTNGYEFEFRIGSYGVDSSNMATNGYYIIGVQNIDEASVLIVLTARGDRNEISYSKTIANAWHHFAICHSNNVLYWFIDGELIRSEDISDPKYQNFITNHGKFKMYTQIDNCFNWSSGSSTVYMDDIVVIKDQCLWTEKFTPPADVLVGNSPKYMQVLYPYSSVNEKDRLKIY